LDHATRLCYRDRFFERLVRAGAAAHAGLPLMVIISLMVCFTSFRSFSASSGPLRQQ
jgi:hypothetical protein